MRPKEGADGCEGAVIKVAARVLAARRIERRVAVNMLAEEAVGDVDRNWIRLWIQLGVGMLVKS